MTEPTSTFPAPAATTIQDYYSSIKAARAPLLGLEHLNELLSRITLLEDLVSQAQNSYLLFDLSGELSGNDNNYLKNAIVSVLTGLKYGLNLDSSVLEEFEKNNKYKNVIFANSIDFIHEFFNFEKKMPEGLSKKLFFYFNKNSAFKKYISIFADRGF